MSILVLLLASLVLLAASIVGISVRRNAAIRDGSPPRVRRLTWLLVLSYGLLVGALGTVAFLVFVMAGMTR